MNRRMLAMLVLAVFCWTSPLMADVTAGVTTYRVTIVLYPGDDAAAIAKRLAAMYRGTLETPVDERGTFVIAVSGATAELLRRDRLVTEMESMSVAALPPSPAPRRLATRRRRSSGHGNNRLDPRTVRV